MEDIFVKHLDACPSRTRGQISLLPLWDLPRASGQGHKDLALHVYLHCDGFEYILFGADVRDELFHSPNHTTAIQLQREGQGWGKRNKHKSD